MNKKNGKQLTVILIFIIVISASLFIFKVFQKNKISKEPVARKWMEFAQQVVKEEKPTPPEAARFYAYVASVYSDVYEKTKSIDQASVATQKIITAIYPEWKAKTDQEFSKATSRKTIKLNNQSSAILNDYLNRLETDGFKTLVWDGVIPTAKGKWIKQNKMPYSPTAGNWERWILSQNENIVVQPPPKIGSPEDLKELEIVKAAIAARDDQWNKKIIYWQGIPGTETPAGIWQNILYEQSQELKLNELTYSKYQKVLAQSLADAFMECWRIKYTFWTARPSMRIPGIVTSMPDPPFPSYVSGHSLISRTAAYVLGSLIPSKNDEFLKLAGEARDSRLYAGIHFQVDNTEGFNVGEEVGKKIVSLLRP